MSKSDDLEWRVSENARKLHFAFLCQVQVRLKEIERELALLDIVEKYHQEQINKQLPDDTGEQSDDD